MQSILADETKANTGQISLGEKFNLEVQFLHVLPHLYILYS